MTTELDTEIRRAVAELADAAPLAPTFDALTDGTFVRTRRPSRRPLATAVATVLSAAAMIAVLLTVRVQDHAGERSRPGESSIAETPSVTSTRGATPGIRLAYGDAATQWLKLATARIAGGDLRPIIAEQTRVVAPPGIPEATDGKVTALFTDIDAHPFSVSVNTDHVYTRGLPFADSAPVDRTVQAGDFFALGPTAAMLHTRTGLLLQAGSCSGPPPAGVLCDPIPPGRDKSSLEALLLGLAADLAEHPIDFDTIVAEPDDADGAARLRSLLGGDVVAPGIIADTIRGASVDGSDGARVHELWIPSQGLGIELTAVRRDGLESPVANTIDTVATPVPGTVAAIYDGGAAFVMVRIAAEGRALTEAESTAFRQDLPGFARAVAAALVGGPPATIGNPQVTSATTGEVPASTSMAPRAQGTYVVVAGDYLLGIARKLGVSLQALLDTNGMTASSVLTVGQRLVVPAGGPTAATSVTERTPLDKSGRYVLDPMAAPLSEPSSIIDAAAAVAVVAARVGEPSAAVRVSVLLGAFVDTADPSASPRLAYAVVYDAACAMVSPDGVVTTNTVLCTGVTTVVDAVTGAVIVGLDP